MTTPEKRSRERAAMLAADEKRHRKAQKRLEKKKDENGHMKLPKEWRS